jgi:hypothetical protein
MTLILLLANVLVLTAIAVAYRRATTESSSGFVRDGEDATHVSDQFCGAGARVAAAG